MSFEVIVDGAEGRCLISREALEQHFGAAIDKTPEEAFADNRWEIESIAARLINSDSWQYGLLIMRAEHIR